MRCEEIMKKDVECNSPDDAVGNATKIMRDRNVGFLPVCDESKRVLGALTDRDVALRMVAADKPSSTPVREIMTRDCVTCRPEDDIETAQKLMAEHRKSRMICVDASGSVVGVLSLSDIAQHESGERASQTLREISKRESKAAEVRPSP